MVVKSVLRGMLQIRIGPRLRAINATQAATVTAAPTPALLVRRDLILSHRHRRASSASRASSRHPPNHRAAVTALPGNTRPVRGRPRASFAKLAAIRPQAVKPPASSAIQASIAFPTHRPVSPAPAILPRDFTAKPDLRSARCAHPNTCASRQANR